MKTNQAINLPYFYLDAKWEKYWWLTTPFEEYEENGRVIYKCNKIAMFHVKDGKCALTCIFPQGEQIHHHCSYIQPAQVGMVEFLEDMLLQHTQKHPDEVVGMVGKFSYIDPPFTLH